MDTVTASPKKAARLLEHYIKIRRPTCMWSDPGIGKSSIERQVATKLKLESLDVRPVLLDPVDLRGLPMVKEGFSTWAQPDFLPRKGKGILFLDELNRAPILVQNACFQLVLDRRLGEYVLPDEWVVVAACNPEGGGVQKMPVGLARRFFHIYLEADPADWDEWAIANNIHPLVRAFLKFKPELLHVQDASTREAHSAPNPRSWEYMSDVVYEDIESDLKLAAYSGTIGQGTALQFLSFEKLANELPDIDYIIANPEDARVPHESGVQYAVSAALSAKMNHKNFKAVLKYLDRMPAEFAVFTVKDAVTRDNTLTSADGFAPWAISHAGLFQPMS